MSWLRIIRTPLEIFGIRLYRDLDSGKIQFRIGRGKRHHLTGESRVSKD